MGPKAVLSGASCAALVFAILPIATANPTRYIAYEAASALSQSKPQATDADDPQFAKFVYDVVSIKPYQDPPNANSSWSGSNSSPDGFTMHNSTLNGLVGQAYRTEHFKIGGAPDWLNKDHFDVEAKMDPEVADALQKLSPADQKLARQHMLRVLTHDYLKLVFHMEATEVPIYDLVVGKNGSKLKSPADPNTPGGMRMSGTGGVMTMDAKNSPLRSLLGTLSISLGRPVYDKTGLNGNYDFIVKYTPERPGSAGPGSDAALSPEEAPTLVIAIEEQLGLKLVSGKGPMDVIVIDHIERPSGN